MIAGSADSTARLFVYGTLHPERAPAEIRPVVRRLRLIGPATIVGRLHDLGAYPGLTLDGEQTVPGHVFALPGDPGVLAALDAYEGFDPESAERSLFLRSERHVRLDDGAEMLCWVYLYHG